MKKITLLLLFLSLYFVGQAAVSKTVNVTAGGDLSAAITTAGGSLTTITNLTITGTIDARDFVTMRDNMPVLAVLDISAVTIAAYNGSGGTCGETSYPANQMPEYSFYNASQKQGKANLTSISIPSSVTSIGYSAFDGCSDLTSVSIPSSITSIGESAFQYCRGLTSVTIPTSVTSIGKSAFLGCSGLTSITIPSSISSIGDSAFQDCWGLTRVVIPNFNEIANQNKQHKGAKILTLDKMADIFYDGNPVLKPFVRVMLDPYSTFNQKSYAVLETGLFFMPKRNIYVGIEGMDKAKVKDQYFKIRKKSSKEALAYAQYIHKEALRCESIHDSIVDAFTSGNLGYHLSHLNPKWTEFDCRRLFNNELWIGMSLNMVCYEYKDYPEKDNVSDYGHGREHQWVFKDGNPSCFYGGDDEIITSYN
jgi:hypothetical protein